jgi:hypothetical protein
MTTSEKSLALPGRFDMASCREEWAVLLECASPTPDAQRFGELASTADWSRLLALAEEHGVLGHLAASLSKHNENIVPAEKRSSLVELYRAQVFRTLGMTRELFRLLELFAGKNIGSLVVKGPVLAVDAYGDPAIRSYGDLDLLVRQRDIRRATEVFLAAGYEATVPLSAIEARKIPGQYLFSRPDSRLLVELHNDVTLRYFPRRLPIEEFFARQTRVRLDGHEVPALSVEDELVYVSVHGATHLWERLGWIADVAALVTRQRDIDWQATSKTARQVGAERMLATGLCLASDLLHARLPAPVLTAVRKDVGAVKLAATVRSRLAGASNAPPTLFERAAFRLRMRGSGFSAPAYLLRLSLSPTEEDWKPGAPENRHGFFEALRRPLRLARKYGRGNKS